MLIYYCKLKKTNPDHLKAFNYCYKEKNCWALKMFKSKSEFKKYEINNNKTKR